MDDSKERRQRKTAHKSRCKKYGITVEQFDALWDKQHGRCAICDIHHIELNRGLFIDHCHETGKVRGLLCVNCNLMIGHAKDDTLLLIKAMEYLK